MEFLHIHVVINGILALFNTGPMLPLAEKNVTNERQEKDNSIKEEPEEETIILEDILGLVEKESIVTEINEENKEHDQVLRFVVDVLGLYIYTQ